MAEQLCGETHAAAVQLFEERADCRNPSLGLRNQQEGEGAANLQSDRRGASAGGEVVENDLGLFLTRHQGKRQHGLLTPIQPEGSQGIGDRRRGHDLDPGSGPHSDSRWIIGRQTAEFLQDEVRNEHRHTGFIQLVQKAQAIEEDDRRRVDDAPRAHSRPPS